MQKIQSLCSLLITAGMVLGQTGMAQDTSTDRAQSADTSTRNSMEVAAGTEIVVRTNDAIDSKTATEGQSFSGSVQEAVTDAGGAVLIPKGADATLGVRQVNTGGTTGSPELTLALETITIRGHRYEVNSSDLEQGSNRGIGKNRRTAEYIGGGAALGTLLGAIAGGGKGAAIGAVAGAAAGGTAQVLTKGKEVKIPAETTLRFKLDQPLSLRATN